MKNNILNIPLRFNSVYCCYSQYKSVFNGKDNNLFTSDVINIVI